MKADASRIEILTFAGVPAYTDAGVALVEAPSPEQCATATTACEQTPLPAAVASPSAPRRRFNAQFATCSLTRDRDALLSVIEGCGNGLETFNTWVHDLLCRPSADSNAAGLDGAEKASGAPAPGGSRGSLILALGGRRGDERVAPRP